MKKSNKTIALLVSCIVLLVAVVGTTIAYLVTSTDPITNTFTPTKVTTTIVEEFDGTVKNNVTVKNTGNIDAYIRAAVVVTWKNDAGEVYATAPVAGTDYTVTWMPQNEDGTETKWVKGSDGYYYYTEPVKAGASTNVLLTNCSPVADKTPDGYHLSVEILAQAIQAVPDTAVQQAWGVTINSGSVTKYNG